MTADDPTIVNALPEVDPKHLPREVLAFDSMTLRDYFAAASLTGLLAFTTGGEGECGQLDPKAAADDAYAFADAMLKARTKPTA